MKRKLFFIVLICLLLSFSLSAQGYSAYNDLSKQSDPAQFGINLRANALLPAPGIEFATKFSSKLTLRAGMDFLQINRKVKRFDPTQISAVRDALIDIESEIGYKPNIDMKYKYKLFTGHAVGDYHPFSDFNSFFVSAGLYFGKPNLNFNVMLTNPKTGRTIMEDLEDPEDTEVEITDTNGKSYTIKPTDDGQAIIDALFGNSVKPYLGLGFGESVPKNRVGVKFELGAYYSGKMKFESPNVVQGDVNELVLLGQDYVAKAIYWTKWLPVMSLGLTIKL